MTELLFIFNLRSSCSPPPRSPVMIVGGGRAREDRRQHGKREWDSSERSGKLNDDLSLIKLDSQVSENFFFASFGLLLFCSSFFFGNDDVQNVSENKKGEKTHTWWPEKKKWNWTPVQMLSFGLVREAWHFNSDWERRYLESQIAHESFVEKIKIEKNLPARYWTFSTHQIVCIFCTHCRLTESDWFARKQQRAVTLSMRFTRWSKREAYNPIELMCRIMNSDSET